MKKLLLSTFIVSQLLSFTGYATDLEKDAGMTENRASTSEKNSEIFNAYDFVSTQQKINQNFIEKYKDYSTIRLQLPSDSMVDLKELGTRLAPLVIKGSGLNFETLDLSFNNWQASQTVEFLEGLTKSQKIERKILSEPSYTGTFVEYKIRQNLIFGAAKAFFWFLGTDNPDASYPSDDQMAESYRKDSQPTFIEYTSIINNDLTLKNINLSHNLIFDTSTSKHDEKINIEKLCNIFITHKFEAINLSHNVKDFYTFSEDNHFYSFVKGLTNQYPRVSATNKLNLKNLDLSSNGIQNLVRNSRGGYGSRSTSKHSDLSDLAKISNIEMLNLSGNPILSDDLEKHTQDDFKTTNIGKILISSHTLSEDLKSKLSDPEVQSKWVIKD